MELKQSQWYWIVGLLAILLYANTFNHQYALDDKIVITENQFTKKGLAGIAELVSNESMVGFFGVKKNLVAGGRYRPIPLVTHAIEWHFFGENPRLSHIVNALLYAANAVLVLWLLLLLFNVKSNSIPWWNAAIIATAIYVAHPLHSEVVANIKGRDDLLSGIGGFLALIAAIKYIDSSKVKWLLSAFLAFTFSLFSKESMVTFVALVPLSAYFFRSFNFKSVAIATAPLILAFLLYFVVRLQVIGGISNEIAKELMNNPFLNASNAEKYATIFITFWLYLKLLVFPHPLTHDYYPLQIPITNFGDGLVWFSILLHLGLIYFMLRGFKSKAVYAFAIALYFITFSIYANVVFPIGTFMNDRFMYFPSLGFAIAIGFVVQAWFEKKRATLPVILMTSLLLIGFSGKTLARNMAWENDFTLAVTDVEISTESAKNNMSAGLAYLERSKTQKTEALKQKDLGQAVKYLQKSISLYPSYMPPNLLMGNALADLGDYPNAIIYYQRCLTINPEYGFAINNLERVGDLAKKDGKFNIAENAYTELLKYSKTPSRIYDKLAELIGKDLGDPKRALAYAEKGLELEPNNPDLLQKMGVIYAITGNTEQAIGIFERAYALDTNNARLLLNIGIAYNNLGKTELGNRYINKAVAKDPQLASTQTPPGN